MRIKLIILILLTLFFENTFSQKIDDLKTQKNKLEEKILLLNDLINKNEKQKLSSANSLNLISKKIELKQKLIDQIDIEYKQLNIQINKNIFSIDSLNSDISNIKENYKYFLLKVKKVNNKYLLLIHLLSSESLTGFYRKIVYYNEYLKFRRNQAQELIQSKEKLYSETIKLNTNIVKLKEKEAERLKEINILQKEKSFYKKKAKQLTQKKRELTKELESNKLISQRLAKEIENLIEQERRRIAKEKNRKESDKTLILSKNFEDNFGNFKQPVTKGILINNFGEKEHPVLKNIKVKNNGVDFTLNSNADVYSIFKGEVRTIFKIPGSRIAIIIRHGKYLCVYSNLSSVNVTTGQLVNTNQKIGEIKSLNSKEELNLHFELWNDNKPENPEKLFSN